MREVARGERLMREPSGDVLLAAVGGLRSQQRIVTPRDQEYVRRQRLLHT